MSHRPVPNNAHSERVPMVSRDETQNRYQYTSTDISNAKNAAETTLQNNGWERVEFAGLYEPVYTKNNKYVQLKRILDTPKYHLIEVNKPDISGVTHPLHIHHVPCKKCGQPIINAINQKGEQIQLNTAYTAKGRYVIRVVHEQHQTPYVTAHYKRTATYGHTNHNEHCRGNQ